MASGREESSFIRHTSDTNYNHRDQWLWLHFKFSVVQNTSKAVKKGRHRLRQYNVYMHEPLPLKRKKDENIYSPLEKCVTVRKQITDSETLIANKMLNSLAVREIQIKQWNTESLKKSNCQK